MQQNDSMPSGTMSVVVVNVALITSPTVAITNATPN
jgi:hypothetical protein